MGGVTRESVQRFALSNLSVILLAAVFLLFAALDSRFLSISNIMNIGSQASFIGIMAGQACTVALMGWFVARTRIVPDDLRGVLHL